MAWARSTSAQWPKKMLSASLRQHLQSKNSPIAGATYSSAACIRSRSIFAIATVPVVTMPMLGMVMSWWQVAQLLDAILRALDRLACPRMSSRKCRVRRQTPLTGRSQRGSRENQGSVDLDRREMGGGRVWRATSAVSLMRTSCSLVTETGMRALASHIPIARSIGRPDTYRPWPHSHLAAPPAQDDKCLALLVWALSGTERVRAARS